jgi:hypothetical protein
MRRVTILIAAAVLAVLAGGAALAADPPALSREQTSISAKRQRASRPSRISSRGATRSSATRGRRWRATPPAM